MEPIIAIICTIGILCWMSGVDKDRAKIRKLEERIKKLEDINNN